jgi:hypothetical protein
VSQSLFDALHTSFHNFIVGRLATAVKLGIQFRLQEIELGWRFGTGYPAKVPRSSVPFSSILILLKSLMKNSPHLTINRSAVILLPKQPFLDWIERVDPVPTGTTLEELRKDQNVFLVSSDKVPFPSDVRMWVNQRWRILFEHSLNEWFTDETMWPKSRTRKMFHEWFDIEFHSMVWDMEDEPLAYEEWDLDIAGLH